MLSDMDKYNDGFDYAWIELLKNYPRKKVDLEIKISEFDSILRLLTSLRKKRYLFYDWNIEQMLKILRFYMKSDVSKGTYDCVTKHIQAFYKKDEITPHSSISTFRFLLQHKCRVIEQYLEETK